MLDEKAGQNFIHVMLLSVESIQEKKCKLTRKEGTSKTDILHNKISVLDYHDIFYLLFFLVFLYIYIYICSWNVVDDRLKTEEKPVTKCLEWS